MKNYKCCVPACDREVTREDTITYRNKYNTLETIRIYFCCDCTIDDLKRKITPETRLKCGGY